MKKIITIMLLTFIAVSPAYAKKARVIRAAGGTNIEQTGIAIDAGYDSRLDAFLPGYKVVNVAFVNNSLNIINLDPEKDVWSLKLEGDRKSHKVIHDLRSADPKSWAKIPDRARGLVSYPLVLPIGAREVIDLFVPESVDVARFTELEVYLASMDTKFDILVRQ